MESKTNLLEVDPVLPLSRVVHGFRLVPFFTACKHVAWVIQPYNCRLPFCFRYLHHAQNFARHFTNSHSCDYWSKIYTPIYDPIVVSAFLDGYTVSSYFFNDSFKEIMKSFSEATLQFDIAI